MVVLASADPNDRYVGPAAGHGHRLRHPWLNVQCRDGLLGGTWETSLLRWMNSLLHDLDQRELLQKRAVVHVYVTGMLLVSTIANCSTELCNRERSR
jgi:hypothetical protein